MMIQRLEFDSELFDYSVGRIDVSKEPEYSCDGIINAVQNSIHHLVYVYSQNKLPFSFGKDDNKVKIGVHSTRVKFGKDLSVEPHVFPQNVSKISKHDDEALDTLLFLGKTSGQYSRFKVDPYFRNHEFDKLYSLWVNRSFNHEIADFIYVLRIDDTILGMVTLSYQDSIGQIGLISVHPEHQGCGFGSSLLSAAEIQCRDDGVKKMIVPTQKENIQACNFYSSKGYSVIKQTHQYHLWNNSLEINQ